jgi:hypothetical protein
MANVNRLTREELARPEPGSDNGNPGNRYPTLGRDVPWKDGPNGYPVMDLDVRVQSYGELGLRRETKCPHCAHWLTYPMCAGCQSMIRMLGSNDQRCACFKETLFIYGHCEDHRRYEQGP